MLVKDFTKAGRRKIEPVSLEKRISAFNARVRKGAMLEAKWNGEVPPKCTPMLAGGTRIGHVYSKLDELRFVFRRLVEEEEEEEEEQEEVEEDKQEEVEEGEEED